MVDDLFMIIVMSIQLKAKERPEWYNHSTVYEEEEESKELAPFF